MRRTLVLLLLAPSLGAAAQEPPSKLCVFCEEVRPRPESPRFFDAASELLAAEAVPWAFDRYVAREDFARISVGTVRENFRTGFQFDNDDFPTNQFQHPYHGGVFFNAARANGYGYWASGLFALAGSLAWECCMENTPPSTNDLVNTTLGGMALGEITHRLAAVIRDNGASGARRFWRELGATFVDPAGGVDRLVHGDWARQFPNPEERFPLGFELAASLGYGHFTGGTPHADRTVLSLSAAYGNPFAGEIRRPFDSFWLEADLNVPSNVITRVEARGILTGRELTEGDAKVRTILGVWQQYEYFHNESQVFGAQAVSLGLLSRGSAAGLVATADVAVTLFPLAGIQTTDTASATTGRTYDYAPGAGVRAGLRVDGARGGAAVAWGLAWARTVNGVSDQSTLSFVRASGRIALYRALGAGAAFARYDRHTLYPGPFEERATQSEWRLFLTLGLGRSAPVPRTQIPQ